MASTTMRRQTARKETQEYTRGAYPRILPDLGIAQAFHQWDSLQGGQELRLQLTAFPSLQQGLNPAFHGLSPVGMLREDGLCQPPVNVRETDDAFVAELYLPRMDRKDINIDVKNGSILVVEADRSQEYLEERRESGYLRREVAVRSYYRSFVLPVEVKREDITARYEDGVLEITLPKTLEAKAASFAVPLRG